MNTEAKGDMDPELSKTPATAERSQCAVPSADQLLASIVESSDDAILSKDLDGIITSWNKGAEKLFGYTANEVIGRTGNILIPADRQDEEPEILSRVRRGIRIDHYETVRQRKDGTLVNISITISPVRDAQGQIVGASKVARDITDRKTADRMGRLLSAIVESSDDAIASKDLNGIITSWNRGAERLFGYAANEVVGRPVTMLMPPERVSEETEILARIRRGDRLEHFQTVRRRKDGSLFDASLTVSPIKDDTGRVIGASKILRDITEVKRAEKLLRESEAELRSLADSIPQLAWMADPSGEVFWFNHRFFEYTGTTLEQMRGWGWKAVQNPATLPMVVERWKHSLATGEPFEMEFPLRAANGTFRWFLTRVNPIKDSEGRVTRWFGTNTDVDTVRRAQEALREETRILELLNDAGTAIAAQLDLQALVQVVTDAATKLCGAKFGAFFYNVTNREGESYLLYTLSGAPREAFEKFGHPRATPLFGPTFRGEGIIRSDDILQDPRYGQTPPHHGMPQGHLPVRSYLAVPVISRSGEVIGGLFFAHPNTSVFTERSERLVTGVAAQAAIAIDNARLYEAAQREISERIRVAEELRNAQAELSRHAEELESQVNARTASLRQALAQLEEFSYSVSHDLRAPLRAVAGYTDIFRKDFGKDLPPEALVFLDKIARSTARMQRLVNDVLSISRVSRAEVDLHPIELQSFIEDIVEQNVSMQEPCATIIIKTPHRAIADDASLGQAISNLLANAVKFVPAGTKPVVTVRSEAKEGRVRIWFEDNGIGIKPEHRSKLFGMFQRLTMDPRYEGTGIGLAIVRKAVERMGGTVGVEPGQISGSRFWVDLKEER